MKLLKFEASYVFLKMLNKDENQRKSGKFL